MFMIGAFIELFWDEVFMIFMVATCTYSCRICVREFYGTDQFGSVRPNDLGPPLNVFDFDQSGHFGWLDRNVPFHLTKLLSPVPLFCILLTRTITKSAVAWVGSVQPECTFPLDTWTFRNFNPEFALNGKCS